MISENKRVMNNRRTALRLIDPLKRTKVNAIRISKANTDEHELMKYLICRQLCKEGKQFLTEVVFLNNKKADIVCLDDLKVIEVLCSETEKKCVEKTLDYPGEFELIMVYANEEFNEKLIY